MRLSNIIQIGGKFYDFGTKNTSFLKTAQELKTLGIKNWFFMLEVKYPNLGVQDIDPYNPNITPEETGKIHVECKNNPWFWLREVARVPARGAPKPVRFEMHRAGCAAAWCFIHNIDFMLCQPRQTYKTTVCMLLTEYAFIYDLKNVEIPFMHRDGTRCLKNAEMFRSYVEVLPKYMNPWSKLKKSPGSKSLSYPEHEVKITPVASADSPEKAMDMLRGITLFVGLIDEFEFIKFISSALAGAAPAMQSARKIAKETGTRTCVMYLSTPGDLDTNTGKEAKRMIDNTPKFSENMYDFDDKALQEFFEGKLTKGENGIENPVTTVYIEFNYKQLRLDDKWLRAQYSDAVSKGEISEYRRGVLLERFRGNGAELFKQEDIDFIKAHVRMPDHEIMIANKYTLYVYNHNIIMSDMNSETPYFDVTIPYLIGVDVAAGGDGDNTAICIVHPYTLEIVAELETPFMGTFDLMRVITKIALLVPRGIFCLETNNVGKAIVDFVQESRLEARFYHDPKLDISKNAITLDPIESMKQKSREKGYYGTYVTPTIRKNMFDLLKDAVKDYRHLLNTRLLVHEIDSLVKDKNGKIQADTGEHDDMVMAYLHTIYVLTYGYDLMRFGIDKTKRTYQKVYRVLEQYESEENEKVVNNMVPTEGGMNSYENQVLSDIARDNRVHANSSGPDFYGYNQNQYNTRDQQPQEHVSISDLSFLYEVQSF